MKHVKVKRLFPRDPDIRFPIGTGPEAKPVLGEQHSFSGVKRNEEPAEQIHHTSNIVHRTYHSSIPKNSN